MGKVDLARVRRLKSKLEKNNMISSKAYSVIFELKEMKLDRGVLQDTGVGKQLNFWIQENEDKGELNKPTLKFARKLLESWRQLAGATPSSSSSSSSSDSSSDSESEKKVKTEKPKEGYKPGSFFFNDVEEEEDEEDDDDDDLAAFIGDDTDMGYLDEPEPANLHRLFDDDDDDPIALLSKLTKEKKLSKKRQNDEYESKPVKRTKVSADETELLRKREKENKKSIRKAQEAEAAARLESQKAELIRKKEKERHRIRKLREAEESARVEAERARKAAKKAAKLAERIKQETEYVPQVKTEPVEDYGRKSKKKSRPPPIVKEEYVPEMTRVKERFEVKSEYIPQPAKVKKEKRREKPVVKIERAPSPVEKKVDIFGSSDDDDGLLDVKTENQNDFQTPDSFQMPERAPRIAHMKPTYKGSAPVVKADPDAPMTLTEQLEEKKINKKKDEKKMKKMKKQTNMVAKAELDTEEFSFEAMMTMNTAKVKKKKSKKINVDDRDANCLQLSQADIRRLPSSAKVAVAKKSEKEMTDREAAFLATSSKRGGCQELILERRRIRHVDRVYPLLEIAQKVLTNHPQFLLNCMDRFIYAADVIMPAMERLDAKSLNLIEEHQPQLEEDTNHIWRKLCVTKYGHIRSKTVEGRGESWKEGYVRLANENDARLKQLTKKIVKKTKNDEEASRNTKLAFVNGFVKAPPNTRHSVGNDLRSKLFEVNVPGYSKSQHNQTKRTVPGTAGQTRDGRTPVDHTGRSRVNVASSTNNASKRKTAPLMQQALRGIAKFKR